MAGPEGVPMNFTGIWNVVSSPDFDDDYLHMEVAPYVKLYRVGSRLEGEYHLGLQSGDLDGLPEGDDPECIESRRFKEGVYEQLADQRGVRVLHLEAGDVEDDVFMGKVLAAIGNGDTKR